MNTKSSTRAVACAQAQQEKILQAEKLARANAEQAVYGEGPDVSPTVEEINALTISIHLLEKAVIEITQKVQPVLSMHYPNEQENGVEIETSRSQIGSMVREQRKRINGVVNQINQTIDMIEL